MPLFANLGFDNKFNDEHTSFDKQLMEEQTEYREHYNPLKYSWRYKIIDKKTGKYYRFTRIPKITKYTTFIDQFNGKYKYIPWPYKRYSLRKTFWFFILIWRRKYDILDSALSSKISSELWIIVRSIIVLLLAYLIWALFGSQIIELIK